MKNEIDRAEVEALCPECGHAFKTYVDRLVGEKAPETGPKKPTCPVCGCGNCSVGK